jgi:inorganic pyrophosphatase
MKTPWSQLEAFEDDGDLHVVVESPRGSTVKLKFDPERGVFSVSRPLVLGLHYPFDWGFIPGTEGPDGDPVDAMLLWDVAGAPGLVVPARPIALVELDQKKKKKGKGRERNDRVLAVPVDARRERVLSDLTDLPTRLKEELGHFFVAVTALEGKDARILGWKGRHAAEQFVRRARKA